MNTMRQVIAEYSFSGLHKSKKMDTNYYVVLYKNKLKFGDSERAQYVTDFDL